ncbi:MAG: MFS transporter [Chloroflexi bacterium]|nr:MFS transporter [Chloroflexota bacterium]MCH8115507.1 MFS transporter [Chloroflexota bacterium]MCI0774117.1 MFS transporter [Chloroflexota bacterium]MCI0802823.1 MFS transporter [Chloroflexota bacterium]MCI0807779.1 MFS transporter [Chloroflexota bacterium]
MRVSILSGTSYSAFKYREYRLFWIAAAFSNIGMWSLVYGRLWLMRTLTGSEVMLGLVATANLAPVLIFSIWGGVLADRFNRLKIVRVTRLLFAITTIGTAVLIQSGNIEPWHVLAISAVTGTLLAFDIPSRSAMVATIVPKEHLAGAIALYSIVFGAAAIVGPMLFSPLVSAWGLEGLFYIIGTSYLLTVLTLLMMRTSGHKVAATSKTVLGGLLQGFTYLRHQKSITSVILLGVTLGLFGTSFDTLLPVFTDEIFSGGTDVFGRLLLGAGIGGLTATMAITLIGRRVRPALYLIIAGVGLGAAQLTFARIDILDLAVLVAGIIGGFKVVLGTMNTTVVQTLVAEEFRGRVLSINQLTWGASALGGLLMGYLAQRFDAPTAMTFGGSVAIVATLLVGQRLLRSFGVGSESAKSDSGQKPEVTAESST